MHVQPKFKENLLSSVTIFKNDVGTFAEQYETVILFLIYKQLPFLNSKLSPIVNLNKLHLQCNLVAYFSVLEMLGRSHGSRNRSSGSQYKATDQPGKEHKNINTWCDLLLVFLMYCVNYRYI